MDGKTQRHLEQLKDFSSLVQVTAALEDTPEVSLEDRYAREMKKNRLLDMATELSHIYPKDAYDLWKQHMPESEPAPIILQNAYDRLSDEQKAATESVLQVSADQEARTSNLHKILFRVIERIDAKYPHKASMPGYTEEEAQGAFYAEIRDVFVERDYGIDAPERQMPSLEDALALTKFLARHNDPAQRAELERLASAHQQRADDSRQMEQTGFDFMNVVEPEPVERTKFASLAELIEHITPLAKEGQIMAAPRDTVLYLDAESNALTIAALSEAAAGELSNEMGFDHDGNPVDYQRHNRILGRYESRSQGQNWKPQDIREFVKADVEEFGAITDPYYKKLATASIQRMAKELPGYAQELEKSAPELSKALTSEQETTLKTEPMLQDTAAKDRPAPPVKVFDRSANRVTFRSTDFELVSTSLAKLALEDNDRNSLRSVVRQILNKRIPDISDATIERARELRQARLIELAELAQKEAAKTLQEPGITPRASDNDVGNAEAIPGADSVKIVPAQVNTAYIRIPDRKGDRFYLNSRLDTVAFIDKGVKLETKSDNEKTALDMVSIADARGWETIKVSGTEAFRRQVWLEASARGLTVRGYKPNEMDKALLIKRSDQLEKNGANSIEQAGERQRPAAKEVSEEAAPTKKNEDVAATVATAAPANSKAKNLSGVLLEHGKAPFEFNADNKPNYYVKYRDDDGTERLTWGLDLERAIAEAEAKAGDKIRLENLGKKPVEVQANVKDDAGKVVGTKTIATHRNSWNVEVARDFLEMPTQEFAAKHPSQVNAAIIKAFSSKAIAEHPKFNALSSADKERLRSSVETEIAKAIGDGKPLPALSVVKRTQTQEVAAEVIRETSRSR